MELVVICMEKLLQKEKLFKISGGLFHNIMSMQGCLGNTIAGNPGKYHLGNKRPSSQYRKIFLKKPFEWLFFPIKRVMKLKYQSLTHTPKK